MSIRARLAGLAVSAVAALAATAGPAGACAGLVTPGGNVRLLRTATLAAYHDGVEHYVTSFRFEGGGAEFGSIIPLPAVPSTVERGGDWTLQRLERETQPPVPAPPAAGPVALAASEAEVVYETRIDALDITILKGGGDEVGRWARSHGYTLTPDAPEVLDFYAARSPVFMAARFNADAARERNQAVGDGTPIHLTIPTARPWVPLRILGLGLQGEQRVDADVYLLTDQAPALLPEPGSRLGAGLVTGRYEPASASLLADLRSDKGMAWVPGRMWLTYLRVDEAAGRLRYDLAVDPTGGGRPSAVAAGLARPTPTRVPTPTAGTTPAATATTAVTSDPATTAPAPATTTRPATAAEAPAVGGHQAAFEGPVAGGGADTGGDGWLLAVGAGLLASSTTAALVVRRRRASR